MLGIQDAEHEETAPEASIRFISKLTCSLVGETQKIIITPGTLTFEAYGKKEVREHFQCNYGLNEEYRDEMGNGELRIVGVDDHGTARIVELSNHCFFIATLFVPQLSSGPETPHPLIIAYLKAAMAFRVTKQEGEVKM